MSQSWSWIDASNRVQISNQDGKLFYAWERVESSPRLHLAFAFLSPFANNQEQSKIFISYQSNSNSLLFYWTWWLNFQEQERFECSLRLLVLPRDAFQAVSLTLGVRPGWIGVAPAEAAFRLRLSALLLRALWCCLWWLI